MATAKVSVMAKLMYTDHTGQCHEIPVTDFHIQTRDYGSGSPLCVQTRPVLESGCPVGPIHYRGDPLKDDGPDPDKCHYCGSWYSLSAFGTCLNCGGPALVKPRRPDHGRNDRDAFVPYPPMEWHMMPSSSSCSAQVRYAVSRNNTHGW